MKNLRLRINGLIFILILLISTGLGQKRNLLTGSYSLEKIQKSLQSRSQWHPFPRGSDREAWQKLPEAIRKAYLKRGEEALAYHWPSLPATLYLDYARTGIRENYQRLYYERRAKVQDLVLAECMEGKGRFLDQILNGIWLLSEETSWVIPAHVKGLQQGEDLPKQYMQVVDLFAAETGTLFAWTYYLLSEELGKLSPLIPERLRDEVKSRILKPNLEHDDFWWMGSDATDGSARHLNNWTPWICSNWLAAILLIEDNQEARVAGVHKAMVCLDRFMNEYNDDGGCDEGPSYWGRAGGSLFECLELLESATKGSVTIYANPLVQEIGRYITRAHIHDYYYVNFSDAPAKVTIQSDLVARYGDKIKDHNLAQLGAYSARMQRIAENGVGGSLSRVLLFLFNLDLIDKYEPKEPLLKDVWLPQSQFMAARQKGGSAEGFYLAAQGLHNDKSHNHNDVGNFIVYSNDEPVIIDVGVETYTAKTFSSDRYSIWTMQSAYHNLPMVNGVTQKNGRQFAAREVQYTTWPDSVRFSMDIAGAYPPEADIAKWMRTITMDRAAETICVRDNLDLHGPSKEITLSLMTPCEVSEAGPGLLVLTRSTMKEGEREAVGVKFDAQKLSHRVETIDIKDNQLKRVWGSTLRRIVLTATGHDQKGVLEVTMKRVGR